MTNCFFANQSVSPGSGAHAMKFCCLKRVWIQWNSHFIVGARVEVGGAYCDPSVSPLAHERRALLSCLDPTDVWSVNFPNLIALLLHTTVSIFLYRSFMMGCCLQLCFLCLALMCALSSAIPKPEESALHLQKVSIFHLTGNLLFPFVSWSWYNNTELWIHPHVITSTVDFQVTIVFCWDKWMV